MPSWNKAPKCHVFWVIFRWNSGKKMETPTRRIHRTGIFSNMEMLICIVNAGKYTSPMDPMGYAIMEKNNYMKIPRKAAVVNSPCWKKNMANSLPYIACHLQGIPLSFPLGLILFWKTLLPRLFWHSKLTHRLVILWYLPSQVLCAFGRWHTLEWWCHSIIDCNGLRLLSIISSASLPSELEQDSCNT